MAATFKPILFGEAVVLVIRRVSFEVARFDVCRAKGPIIYLAQANAWVTRKHESS